MRICKRDKENFCGDPCLQCHEIIVEDELVKTISTHIEHICEELFNDYLNSIDTVIRGIANELYLDGVTWLRILTLIIFGSKFVTYFRQRNRGDLEMIIKRGISSYVTEEK